MNLSAPTVTATGNNTVTITYIASPATFPPDDGLAGVREPRRPLPVAPSEQATR